MIFFCLVSTEIEDEPIYTRTSQYNGGLHHMKRFLRCVLWYNPTWKTGVHLPTIPVYWWDSVRAPSSNSRCTSPFAFTGNKFEFRVPGSALSISGIKNPSPTISLHWWGFTCTDIRQSFFNTETLHCLIFNVFYLSL
jgi:hypothetical protein